MADKRTAWHFFFGILLRKRGPQGIEIRDEWPLSEEPSRLDYLILRKTPTFDQAGPATTLRGLWPRLPRVAAVEFKSIGRTYRSGNLDRLWSYTHIYCAGDPALLERRAGLCAVLILPLRTPTLDTDIARMGLAWNAATPGYWQVTGGLFPLHVVEIDVVAEQEDDDLLRLFGHAPERTLEARRFWAEQVGSKEANMEANELEDYDEVMQKMLDTLSPELRLAGLSPELRLAGLAPEQVLLALPDAVLRGLSEDYIATLPPAAQQAIRARRAK